MGGSTNLPFSPQQEAEAQRQITQMVNFILNEARDKAQEIEARALEEFNIEKLKLVQHKKNQVRQEYQQKAKRMETERAIARSNAVNKCRLRKIGARNAVLDEIVASAKNQLAKIASENRNDEYLNLCTDLIAQACLMLLEETVVVQVRPEDKKIVAAALPAAQKKVQTIIESETGVKFTQKLLLDEKSYLPSGPSGKDTGTLTCSGGVVVSSVNRKITVDNTLDARLGYVMKDKLPTVRQLLFPVQ